jgi:uncharacterized membrane protein YgcG
MWRARASPAPTTSEEERPACQRPAGASNRAVSGRYAPRVRRWIFLAVAAAWIAAGGTLLLVNHLAAGEGSFPPPVVGQSVYDPAEAIPPEVEAALEGRIDAIEARSGAELVVYLRIDPTATPDSNLDAARGLMRQWGVGRAGFDDGLVILISFDDSAFRHGEISTWAGDGFRAAYVDESAQTTLREEDIIPAIRAGNLGGGLLSAIDRVAAAITPEATRSLEGFRVLNAIVGIPLAILALVVTSGFAFLTWRRYGDDPELSDSPSILVAGPPAGMTPPLATVVRQGRATQHSLNTTLVELAGAGHIAFRNLDRIGKIKADDEPNPLLDPAIDVKAPPNDARALAPPEAEAYETLRREAIGGVLTRQSLWSLNDGLASTKDALESEALRLGWFEERPSPMIRRWVVIGIVELFAAAGLVWLAFNLPMSGLTLLGGAIGVGGLATAGFGAAMSKRTPTGAFVDGMLKGYRRTLQKTLERAKSMNEVVADPTVQVLADTPDKAVVWGIALGLHREVAEVVERGLRRPGEAGAQSGYYPTWLGSSSWSGGDLGTAGSGGASLFSGSGVPDVGGMFSSLGSLGSSPASSSGGGGFGGGGGGGGGGGSSSF